MTRVGSEEGTRRPCAVFAPDHVSSAQPRVATTSFDFSVARSSERSLSLTRPSRYCGFYDRCALLSYLASSMKLLCNGIQPTILRDRTIHAKEAAIATARAAPPAQLP